jgi:uncharacterized RDD family membrane protein YckC
MVVVMNAIAQVSAASISGPKLDNRRVLAAVVDLLIVSAGALVVLFAGDALTGDRGGALSAVILGWALYYYFALESGAGQTVGKKLMKLRVVCADGRPAGMREIAVRTILRVVDGIGVYIVGLIVMLVTGQRRQRIGDLAAGTIVVDASGPATAVAEPAAPEAEVEAQVEDVEDEAPVNTSPDPTRTITLPSRPPRPEPLSGADEPETEVVADEPAAEPVAEHEPDIDVEPVAVEDEPADEQEPVVEFEPVRADDDALVEDEPVAEVESFEVEPFEVEPIELESVVPVEPTVDVDEPRAEESVVPVEPTVEVHEPTVEVDEPEVEDDAEEALPSAMSPSLEGLAADVAAKQETGHETGHETGQDDGQDQDAEDDGPVNVRSVETVSAMDLIMGAAEEDSAKSDEDDGPTSA